MQFHIKWTEWLKFMNRQGEPNEPNTCRLWTAIDMNFMKSWTHLSHDNDNDEHDNDAYILHLSQDCSYFITTCTVEYKLQTMFCYVCLRIRLSSMHFNIKWTVYLHDMNLQVEHNEPNSFILHNLRISYMNRVIQIHEPLRRIQWTK